MQYSINEIVTQNELVNAYLSLFMNYHIPYYISFQMNIFP